MDANLERLHPEELAGQLLLVGFSGTVLPAELERALGSRERAGVILFRRNLPSSAPEALPAFAAAVQDLCGAISEAADPEFPPIIAVDEEGGRVARLGPPALTLPPMREIADRGAEALLTRVGETLGRELSCLGFSMNFAPVVDVDTNPDNPIIGDRALSSSPEAVVRFASAYMRGLRAGGVHNCLKHYPGHGDTLLDSHLALPTVAHPRARLEAVELLPFRQLAAQADSVMTAHVTYPELDPLHPATLSHEICTRLLREELGFTGMLFSDDLEMQAIAGSAKGAQGELETMDAAACAAIRAGCDVLLVCSRADAQERVHATLTREIERDAAFRARCLVAARRSLLLRRSRPPRPGTREQFQTLLETEIRPLEADLGKS